MRKKQSAKKTAKKSSSLKAKKVTGARPAKAESSHGYTIVAKESKPTFSKSMVNKMMAMSN